MKTIRIGHAGRNRLLDQRGDSGLQERQRDLDMGDRRHGNRHGLHATGELTRIAKRRHTEFRSDLLGACAIDVDNTDQVDIVHRRQQARVVLAEMADADDANAHFVHLTPGPLAPGPPALTPGPPPLAPCVGGTRPTITCVGGTRPTITMPAPR